PSPAKQSDQAALATQPNALIRQSRTLMKAGLPNIWTSAFTDHSESIKSVDFHLPDNSLDRQVALRQAAKWPDGKPLTPELVPDYIFFELYDLSEKYRSSLPDWFTIIGGVHVVSEKFRDFLAGFDLGANQFFEVPLYEFDQKTRRPGR
ncbi:MAG: hypothetical protein MUF63_03805, partial [Rhodobacteraceae bacterium]|nr:hypothetical protein [Paracoccaceae bacterium]